MTICQHCERFIEQDADGTWIDPEATGDDIIWRETCGDHDTFTAEHEPVTQRYLVEWSMNIDAHSPEDAARQALGIHRDPESLATVFHMYGDDGSDTVVDIEDPNEPITL